MRSIRETFLNMVRDSKIFSKEKILNYINVVMYGRTSIKNYENLKIKCRGKRWEDEFQAILFKEIKSNYGINSFTR